MNAVCIQRDFKFIFLDFRFGNVTVSGGYKGSLGGPFAPRFLVGPLLTPSFVLNFTLKFV